MPVFTMLVFLGTATACVVYNRQVAEYFSANLLKILQWFFLLDSRLQHYLLWIYRILLYMAAAFCVVAVAVYVCFGLSSAHSLDSRPPAVSTADHVDHCSLIMPIEQRQAVIDRLDRSETSFASTTQDVMGETTEGGAQVTYTQGGVRQIVEQRFYGETGRSVARIYYTSGKPFALTVLNLKYAVPLSVDNNGKVQSSENREYFLDENGVVCSWMLNDKPQPTDENTIENIKTYLAGVL
jgi:hypothetical protein